MAIVHIAMFDALDAADPPKAPDIQATQPQGPHALPGGSAAPRDSGFIRSPRTAETMPNAYKVPEQITLMDELPLSPTGKVDRKRLHAEVLKQRPAS